MTTSDAKVEEMSEKVEEVKQRSVSELLTVLEKDNTFQGMTDDEIRSIIKYEKQLSEMDGNIKRLNSKTTDYHAEMSEQTATALQNQEKMLQSLVDRATNLQLKVVQYG